MKNGAYIVSLGECKSKGTHLIVLHVSGNSVIYFDSFGVEHVPGEIKGFIGNNSII